jgi:ubiquinone/menaquinone biosynthesis C-methylase UbiE
MSNDARKDREVSHWREWQEKAESVWGWQTPAGQARSARRARFFREWGHMNSQSRVLEIGCGTGEFTRQVAPHVGQLWATDLSPDLLRKAETKISQACPQAKVIFQVQDAMNLSLEAIQFDAVFGCSMLHHVDVRPALTEVFRVLRPGGWCVFSEPNMLNPQIALQKNIGFIKRRMGDSPDETAFFGWQLRRLLRDLGFARIVVKYFDFLHPLTPVGWIDRISRLSLALENCPGLRALSGSLIFGAQKPGAKGSSPE